MNKSEKELANRVLDEVEKKTEGKKYPMSQSLSVREDAQFNRGLDTVLSIIKEMKGSESLT